MAPIRFFDRGDCSTLTVRAQEHILAHVVAVDDCDLHAAKNLCGAVCVRNVFKEGREEFAKRSDCESSDEASEVVRRSVRPSESSYG